MEPFLAVCSSMSGHETMPCVAHTKQYQVCTGMIARRVPITHTRRLDRQVVVQYSSRSQTGNASVAW